MRRSGLFVVALLFFAGFLAATAPNTQADEGDHKIVIGVKPGTNQFNVTEFTLDKNTEYTIVFYNPDAGETDHNLRIDVNQDADPEDTATHGDSEDVVVGPENGKSSDGEDTWEVKWTTPDEDTDITFFCGYQGHYAGGMEGTFVIGEGDTGFLPGFSFFFAIATLFIVATAIPRIRK